MPKLTEQIQERINIERDYFVSSRVEALAKLTKQILLGVDIENNVDQGQYMVSSTLALLFFFFQL